MGLFTSKPSGDEPVSGKSGKAGKLPKVKPRPKRDPVFKRGANGGEGAAKRGENIDKGKR